MVKVQQKVQLCVSVSVFRKGSNG